MNVWLRSILGMYPKTMTGTFTLKNGETVSFEAKRSKDVQEGLRVYKLETPLRNEEVASLSVDVIPGRSMLSVQGGRG
jgi:hypothetical protein